MAGYNFPVSVKHLHLHMVLPPFKHEKVFQYPRWHPHEKVLKDLEEFGEVRDYERYPNEEEGAAEYARAMKGHSELCSANEKEKAREMIIEDKQPQPEMSTTPMEEEVLTKEGEASPLEDREEPLPVQPEESANTPMEVEELAEKEADSLELKQSASHEGNNEKEEALQLQEQHQENPQPQKMEVAATPELGEAEMKDVESEKELPKQAAPPESDEPHSEKRGTTDAQRWEAEFEKWKLKRSADGQVLSWNGFEDGKILLKFKDEEFTLSVPSEEVGSALFLLILRFDLPPPLQGCRSNLLSGDCKEAEGLRLDRKCE